MSTLSTAAKNAAVDAVVDLIDGGTGVGKIEFQTSGDVEVATCAFSVTAFGAATAGKATAAAITDDSSATGGIIAHASIQDGDSTEIFTATCGTSGTEFIMSSLTIAASDTVSVTSMTLEAA